MKIGIIGLGNMGEAIVRGLLRGGVKKNQLVAFEIKPTRIESVGKGNAIEIAKDLKELAKKATHIILAVKPQDAKVVIGAIAPFVDESKIVVSIMAGITTSSIISMLEKPAKVIRIMPNICIKTGEGALGVSANYLLQKEELSAVVSLLQPLGLVVEVGEEHMDAITSLSASGPAFFLAFLEAMIDGGLKMGLPRDKASALAVQAIKGAISLLEQEKVHPTLMKEMITSPGGTTIAGLALLEDRAFKGSVIRALEAAQNRARELSK